MSMSAALQHSWRDLNEKVRTSVAANLCINNNNHLWLPQNDTSTRRRICYEGQINEAIIGSDEFQPLP